MGCFETINSGLSKNVSMAVLLKGRTQEQQSVIKYFLSQGGCLSGITTINDSEFDRILLAKVQGLNIRDMALKKLCIDESQVNEIDPIYLDGYYFDEDDKDIYIKTGKDNLDRCSKYQLSCMFFSSEQMYLYSYLFDLTNMKTTEETVEYFYKDITGISVDTKVREKLLTGKGCTGFTDLNYITNKFLVLSITVPGDFFRCSMRSEKEQSILGMKNLIREKKQQ